MLRTLITALVFAVTCPAHALDLVDYSDIWWNPNESGWGVNFAQSDTFIFATFFVYAANGQPTWFTGQMNADGTASFSGTLYATTGPYFGGAFNPALVTPTAVGTVSFVPSAPDQGVLTYSVSGVNVAKNIQRQSLTTITLGGNYKGGFLDQVTGCSNNAQNGSSSLFGSLTVTQNTSNRVQLSVQIIQSNGSNGALCTISGDATQVGKLFSIPNASYSCSNGLAVNAVVTELKATSQGIEGRYHAATGGSCQEDVVFSAVLL